jgi:BirA family transcriptional regulator, biotin operon repressor / biotin---[acetyl-CoA-carboxylase] ligase
VADLSIDDLRSRIAGCSIGRDLRYFSVVDSTNRVAADLPPGEWVPGSIILADYQAAGRGRSGRSWTAPPGTSVMLSLLLPQDRGIASTDYVMMMALAVRDAVSGATSLAAHLKWPNDVLVGNRKVAGILGEWSSRQGDERVILGVGINVNFGDSIGVELPDTATSLDAEVGHPLSREEVTAGVICCLDLWYRGLTHRPDDVFDAWAAALDLTGLPISVQDAGTTWNGIALGVRRDGGLLVESSDGNVRCVYAGDVSVRHPGGFTAR